jgi:hypothetical protein
MMLLINAIFYPFKDGGWFWKAVKVGFSILLFGAPPFGYAVRVAQAVSDGHEDKLPDTNAFGDFGRGLQILFAFLIYTIIPILIIRALQSPTPVANSFTLNIDFNGILVQSLRNFIIALPFTLAFLVGFVRFITTDSFVQFFNLPKSLEYFLANATVILSHYLQAYFATLVFSALASILAITICGLFICYGWMFFIWGYTIGTLAHKLDLSWKSGKSQVTFGFK